MASYPGGAPNTFVPSTVATNNLVVDFSRNPKSFPLNRYVEITPVTKGVGLYTEMTVEEAGRMLNSDAKDDVWADGEDAPSGRGNTESFAFKPYQTTRYTKEFRIGDKAVDQASFDILRKHLDIRAQHAMTRRTQIAITALTASGNYASSHYNTDVTGISGVTGKWDQSTTARKDIKRCIDYALDIIRLDTLGAVKLEDFRLILSPAAARQISVCQEIVDMVKQSPDALAEVKGELGPRTGYGLPSVLYGLEVVIEDTVKVTSRKGATKAASYVLGGDYAIIAARPGSLESPKDSNTAPRFSTLSMFMLEDMSVEEKHDVDNRVHKGRITDDFAAVMTAAVAGFVFTDILT